ncbi:MAG: hypothetical protein IKT35_03875 [Clostridia bacterium]|nr:hypothetical protein [Clostridia bacterium]
MKKFDITYYFGPSAEYIVDEKIIADIADAGFTMIPLNCDIETNKKVLPILNQYGIRAIVSDSRVNEVYNSNNISAADDVVKQVVEDYKDFDNIIGWDLVDEPHESNFPILAAIVRAFRRYSPEKETYMNLFPNYATPEQLGSPDFVSHLEAFVNIVNPHSISYDHYHFLGRQNRKETLDLNVDERERLIRLSAEITENRGGFFENIEDVRNIALKYDIPPILIVLLTEHGPYRNLTRSELFWEVNMCLAYGMKRISYFTYWEPPFDPHWQWTNAMCDTEGNKMQHWYDVKEINSVIAPIGKHLFSTTSKEVFHIGTPEDTAKKFDGYDGVSSVDGENGVIGFFDDGSIYLVNRDFANANTFTIYSEKPLSVFANNKFIPTNENTFTTTLGAGEAVLLKI